MDSYGPSQSIDSAPAANAPVELSDVLTCAPPGAIVIVIPGVTPQKIKKPEEKIIGRGNTNFDASLLLEDGTPILLP
jgi:hypothetical protein